MMKGVKRLFEKFKKRRQTMTHSTMTSRGAVMADRYDGNDSVTVRVGLRLAAKTRGVEPPPLQEGVT